MNYGKTLNPHLRAPWVFCFKQLKLSFQQTVSGRPPENIKTQINKGHFNKEVQAVEAAVLTDVKRLMYYGLLHFITEDRGQEADQIRNISFMWLL